MKRPNVQTSKRPKGVAPNSGTLQQLSGAHLWTFGRFDVWTFALVHAALFVAALPPARVWPLAFLIPVPFALLVLRAPSFRSMLLPLLIAQMAAWLWLFRWIIHVTEIGFPALALYHSVHTLLMAWVLRRLAFSKSFSRMPMTLLLPLVWTAMEFFRGDVAFSGYPWYMIGQPMIDWLSFAQSSDLFGMYFITFLTAMPAGVAIDVMMSRTPGLTSGRLGSNVNNAAERPASPSIRVFLPPPRKVVRPGVVAIAVLIANVVYGQLRMAQTSTLAPGPRILAIQTNLPQSNKVGWSIEQQAIDVPEFMRLTREAFAAEGGPEQVDLFAWPETMVPSLGFEVQTRTFLAQFGENAAHLTRWADAAEALSLTELQTPMLAGANAWLNVSVDAEGSLEREREHNSVYLLQDAPPYQRYDKVVLTPYGETMPYISEWKWLERQMLAFGAGGMQFNLDAGSEIRVLELKGKSPASGGPARDFTVGTPICFEDTVATLCRKMAYADGQKRLDAFVNVSNEGWFGDSAGDRILHAQIARFRCIENRVPMVRCCNTGISMHIDSTGRIVDRVGSEGFGAINQTGWLLANVQTDARQTLFGRIGHAFPITCMLVVFAMLIQTFLRRSKTIADDSGASR